MPKENQIGYGKFTPIKIEHLSKIFEMHLSVTHAVLNKYPNYIQTYRYIDATAGQGFTPDGTTGSPLVFLERAERFQMNYRADFIECQECNVTELAESVRCKGQENNWRLMNINYHNDQYEKIIPSLLPADNKREYGLVFVDPSGDLPDFNTLSYIYKVRPKMDILIYLSATNVKRQYKTNRKLLSDYMTQVGKNYWLIRKPIDGDPHQWTFLLGSRGSIFETYKSIDFLRFESQEAQKFFPLLNLSEKQRFRKHQPSLFGDEDDL